VLVALVDERDGLHAQASRDLRRAARAALGVTSVVLAETCFLVPSGYLRGRLRFILQRLGVSPVELELPWWDDVMNWLERYQEHEPDLADAQLAVLCARRPRARVWTYDAEFRTTWRRPDGSSIPLFPARAPR
jgi:predicted nucleic acid-binding protein